MTINGEGIGGEESSEAGVSIGPRCDVSSISDDNDTTLAISHYSSCGESDFERYCSADSVMGTPSFRSSGFDSIDGFDFDAAPTTGINDDDVEVCGLRNFTPSDVSADLCRQQGHKLSISNTIDIINGAELVEDINLSELPNTAGSVTFPDSCARGEVDVELLSGLKVCEDVVEDFDKNQKGNASIERPSVETGPNKFHDIVDEMEDILLEPDYSPESKFRKCNMFQNYGHLASRDGGSTASTSGSSHEYPLKIDDIEVVGVDKRSGNISFGERLVGVKEYIVYKLQVRRGHCTWEVERRYRDFCTLCYQIRAFYADRGLTLPSPWLLVEKESKKIFGNSSASIIRERSDIIQSCLQSAIHSEILSDFLDILFWFLSPPKALPCTHISSVSQANNNGKEQAIIYGKTISLVVANHPFKSMKQLLEAQHYICAGCYKHFDCRKTGFSNFLQTLGWGKPRLCSYTGQLFCSSCHTNDMAVLPARVLNHWDFVDYPVSQLSKSFLDSIHTQPMLCASAVNPFLLTKVQSMLHVMNIRRRISSMLPHVHCPFRLSIHRGLGSRKYLLESDDFFSLRDLIDLSKGAFATLPPMLESVSRKIREHITENCLVCCDMGVPCGAGGSCRDMSSLIFPFQEGEVGRCGSCGLAFHKMCFAGTRGCSCGWRPPTEVAAIDGGKLGQDSGTGFLSGLFSKKMKMKMKMKEEEEEGGGALILMASLPTTTTSSM